jgi:hypothetical protein
MYLGSTIGACLGAAHILRRRAPPSQLKRILQASALIAPVGLIGLFGGRVLLTVATGLIAAFVASYLGYAVYRIVRPSFEAPAEPEPLRGDVHPTFAAFRG